MDLTINVYSKGDYEISPIFKIKRKIEEIDIKLNINGEIINGPTTFYIDNTYNFLFYNNAADVFKINNIKPGDHKVTKYQLKITSDMKNIVITNRFLKSFRYDVNNNIDEYRPHINNDKKIILYLEKK